jgi:hypothetical protein
MAYDLASNKPSSNGTQSFKLVHPWEAKHALGVRYSKFNAWQKKEGIIKMIFIDGRNSGLPGKFIIKGTPSAVDQVMQEMADELRRCQHIHLQEVLEDRMGW